MITKEQEERKEESVEEQTGEEDKDVVQKSAEEFNEQLLLYLYVAQLNLLTTS